MSKESFVKVPKWLLKSELSSDAMILYIHFLDRFSLSQKNGWKDADGRTYIIFPVSEAMKKLRCSRSKASRVYGELDGLIERKRQGLCKPDIIYLKENSLDDKEIETFEDSKMNLKRDKNETSECIKNETPDVSNLAPNNINNNKNKYIKNNIYIPSYPSYHINYKEEGMEYKTKYYNSS